MEEKIDITENNKKTPLTYIITKITPNPAQDFIKIVSNNSIVEQPFKLFNQEGQELKKGILREGPMKLDISDLIPGTYILKLTNSKESHKIIKI